jgi:hypothetical protein
MNDLMKICQLVAEVLDKNGYEIVKKKPVPVVMVTDEHEEGCEGFHCLRCGVCEVKGSCICYAR